MLASLNDLYHLYEMGRGLSFIFVGVFTLSMSFGLPTALATGKDVNKNISSEDSKSKNPTGMSRRGFLKSFLSGAAIVAVNPMQAITASMEGLKLGLPEALKRQIVKLRLGTISQVGSEAVTHPDPFYGLKKYIELLEDLIQKTPNLEHKAILMKKVTAAEETLVAFKEVYLRGLSANPSSAQVESKSKIDESWKSELSDSEIETESLDLARELESKPIDIRVITIRTLLGPGLLRKMAWQVHFGNSITKTYSEVLNRTEINLIIQYYSYLHQALVSLRHEKHELERRGLSNFGVQDSVSEFLLVQFMEEAREVILSYHKSVRPNKSAALVSEVGTNSCQDLLR